MTTQTKFQRFLTEQSHSSIQKYMSLVIGRKDVFSLIRYELITSIFGSFPGALGLFLRKFFYKSLFRYTGQGVTFGRNITIRNPKKISIGNYTTIDENVVLDAKGDLYEEIVIGQNAVINRNVVLSCKGGSIYIGDNTHIGIGTIVHSEKMVKIGNNILTAAYCYFIGSGSHKTDRIDIPIIAQGQEPSQGITIEDGVWIGAGVKILDGVTVGHDSIIGTDAVVNKDIPPFSIAVGIPARVIKKREAHGESISG